jgi:hypothetical protein
MERPITSRFTAMLEGMDRTILFAIRSLLLMSRSFLHNKKTDVKMEDVMVLFVIHLTIKLLNDNMHILDENFTRLMFPASSLCL